MRPTSPGLALLVLLGLHVASCAPPEGRFRCETAAMCPLGWQCVAGHCYADPSRVDAGETDGGEDVSLDAGIDATDAP